MTDSYETTRSRTIDAGCDRRTALVTMAAVAGGVSALGGDTAYATDYEGLKSGEFLGDVEVLAEVKADKVFTEGPACNRAGDLFFTNVPDSAILKWSPVTKELTVYRRSAGAETNGLYFDPDGNLLACEGGARRVTRTDQKNGEVSILVDDYQGKPLAKPNDLCQDAQGRIYFTSRSAVKDPDGENPKGVYRIDPGGVITRLLAWPDVHMPNGIVISPDNKTLYLIEAHPDADRHRDIRAYDLQADGSLKNGRVLIDFYPGRSGDGMCIDREGNLYVAAGLHKTRNTSETLATKPGIHVISPQGKLLSYRQTPEDTITNCTFGGKDLKSLYVTCGTKLLRIPTQIAGKASYRPTR